MKSTLETHLVVGIRPMLIADVLFETVATLRRGRHALYIKASLAREFWEERRCSNEYHLHLKYAYQMYAFHFIFF